MVKLPLAHLKSMSTSVGLYEHAKLHMPRPEHGYCVDDVSRGLIFLCREKSLDAESLVLLDLYLDFTLSAITDDGNCHNRMNIRGEWTDEPAVSDWWGRAAWGLGICAVHAPKAGQRERALHGFRTLALASTPHLMALAFATLGAGEVLLAYPDEAGAREILLAARSRLLPADPNSAWLWPEPRLRYSNGSVVQAVLLAGQALGDKSTVDMGLRMLEFLLEIETSGEHFSVTPVGGRGPGDAGPAFDQQPIELMAIAGACSQAWAITGEEKWITAVNRAWDWFAGRNDVGAKMFLPATGAGYDGLHLEGPNLNQGAESTLSMLSTAQSLQGLKKAN